MAISSLTGWVRWTELVCPIHPPCHPCPDCPKCPDCPIAQVQKTHSEETEYMKDMIKYLTLIIKRYEAEKELYVLSHGYAQVYNSPKMSYIKKELRRMKNNIKSNPQKLRYFEMNLNNVIE
jgi:hypothetical protein